MNMKKLFCTLLALLLVVPCFSLGSSALIIQQPGYKNLATGCSYSSTAPFTGTAMEYQKVDGTELTDGKYPTDMYGTDWVAYDYRMNTKPEIIVDLGEVKTDLVRLNLIFRAAATDGVSLPNGVDYYISQNGTDFELAGSGAPAPAGVNYNTEYIADTAFSARYVKAVIKATATFNFVSEFEVCIAAMVDVEVPDPDTDGFLFPGTSRLVRKNGRLFGIAPETSYEALGKYFVKGLSDITVYDKKGNVKTSGYIATGDVIVKQAENNPTENDRATVVIEGDVNCDGKLNATDYALIKRTCLGTFQLDESVMAAACITNGTTLKASDYALVKRHVLGTYDIGARYEKDEPVYDSEMTLKKTSASEYTLSFTYQGKAASLTLDKKAWGTWNIGTFKYDNKSIAGGGTDWEYVYRASATGSGAAIWSGGNHGNEILVSFDIFDASTGKRIDLATGSSVTAKGLKIVEKTKMLSCADPYENTATDSYKESDIYCETTRTYYLSGNRIELDVDYNYVRDVYFQMSYTAMFPVYKTFGRNFVFNLNDGTTFSGQTTDGTVYTPYGDNYFKGYEAQKVSFSGINYPNWKFEVEFTTPYDSTDNFSNESKVMLWDMNQVSDKLYVSKYSMNGYTLVEAGTNFGTNTVWTFNVEA